MSASPAQANVGLILQRDNRLGGNNLPLKILGIIAIYWQVVPIMFLDISLSIYQEIYFRAFEIPRVPRGDYIVMDRSKLNGLGWLQKLNCVYCEYANGLVNWARAVAGQTEIYSCAIKHATPAKGQDHQKEFYEYSEFIAKS
jgi:hypothetical protein